MLDKLRGWITRQGTPAPEKIDLTDVTFIIPIRIDQPARITNAQITLNYILKYFNTNLIITENGPESNWGKFGIKKAPNIEYIFQKSDDPIFYRTKILNEMLAKVKTPVTANYDIDALLPISSYVKARDLIINQEYDLILPFSPNPGRRNIGEEYKELLAKTLDLNSLKKPKPEEMKTKRCKGFAVFLNTKSYLEAGGENENFISWGWEDYERIKRFERLGYKVGHGDNAPIKEMVYHLKHGIKFQNTSKRNPHSQRNYDLLKNMHKIPVNELAKSCAEGYKKGA